VSDLGQCPNGCGELVANERRAYCIECGATPGFIVGDRMPITKVIESSSMKDWFGLEEEHFFKPEDVKKMWADCDDIVRKAGVAHGERFDVPYTPEELAKWAKADEAYKRAVLDPLSEIFEEFGEGIRDAMAKYLPAVRGCPGCYQLPDHCICPETNDDEK